MNALTFSIFSLNKGSFATSTLVPPFYCNRVATCYCRPAIKIKNCSSQVREEDCSIGTIDCSIDCCCCCQNIFGSGDGNDDNNDDFSYKDE